MEEKPLDMGALTGISIFLPCIVTALIICLALHLYLLRNITPLVKSSIDDLQPFLKSMVTDKKIPAMKQDILTQFDDFMQHRLTREMPVLNMFIDDLLILELKNVFEKEMDSILPRVMDTHLQLSSADISVDPGFKKFLQPVKKRINNKFFLFYALGLATAVLTGCFFSLLH